VVYALGAWFVSFVRSHTAQSAVRQATDMAGGTPEATQLAADELRRMPWIMRPGNVEKAVDKAVEKERVKRESVAPLPPPPLPPRRLPPLPTRPRATMPSSLPQNEGDEDN